VQTISANFLGALHEAKGRQTPWSFVRAGSHVLRAESAKYDV